MKKLLLAAALLLVLCGGLRAQVTVTVEVRLDQEQFLPGESLPASVRIVNRSGQTLHLGEDADWLTFSIESRDGSMVGKNSDVPVVEAFDLESSKVGTKHVELVPYFSLNKPGHYEVTAAVRKQIQSPAKSFDIIEGTRLWDTTFGLPGTNAAEPPEMRKYILQQANYLRTQLRLYLRVTDATESHPIRVFAIGPMVSFSRPEPQLDQQSNLHLLYQNGAHTFSYTEINPAGDLLIRQTFDYSGSRPRLKKDDAGKIFVAGGVRHEMLDDLPEKNPAGEPKPPQTPQP